MGHLGRREKGKKGKKKERRGIYPYANNAEIDENDSVSELCVFQKDFLMKLKIGLILMLNSFLNCINGLVTSAAAILSYSPALKSAMETTGAPSSYSRETTASVLQVSWGM